MNQTTNTTAGIDLAQLDKLEALARAATPGPWNWWTSNSVLRLTGADDRDGGVLHAYARGSYGDISCSPANQGFIAAANPATVQQLVALARRSLTSGAPAEPVNDIPDAWKLMATGLINQLDAIYKALERGEGKQLVVSIGQFRALRTAREMVCGAGIPKVAVAVHDAAAPSAEWTEDDRREREYFDCWPEAGAAAKTEHALDEPVTAFKKAFHAAHHQGASYDEAVATGLSAAGAGSDQAPTHETIVQEGGDLVCTACGTSASVTVQDERALFEQHLRNEVKKDSGNGAGWQEYATHLLSRAPDGDYRLPWVQAGWEYWQARAALTQQAGAAAPSREDAVQIKTWQERMPEHVRFLGTASSESAYKDAEIADLRAALARAPLPAQSDELTDVLRDMMAIQEVCGLHTDEYAPGSVIEYIKELEGDAAHPVQDGEKDALTQAACDVLAERRRQVEAEGWTPAHDDQHGDGSMADAAGCYASFAYDWAELGRAPSLWPWNPEWWKPSDPRRNLVKAGALILAEVERLDREAEAVAAMAAAQQDAKGEQP